MTDSDFANFDFQGYMQEQGVPDAPVLAGGKRYDVKVYRPQGSDPTPQYIADLHHDLSRSELRRRQVEHDAGKFLWELRRWQVIAVAMAVSALTFLCIAFWALGELSRAY